MKIFINFKNYSSGLGQKQVELLDFLESISCSFPSSANCKLPTANSFNLVVPTSELSPIWQRYSFPLWSEHCDPVDSSKATGWVSAEQIKEAGGIGTMLNHSEHRLPFSTLEKTVEICQKNGLKTLVCCQSVEEGKEFAKLKPDFLAYEPPELIASKTASVISKSKEIKELASFLSNPSTYYVLRTTYSSPRLLVGAGIRTHEDIKKSETLGANGILLASSVMENSKEEIEKLLSLSM